MNLVDHALADLRAQRDGLEAEFQIWRARTDKGAELHQHHSQVIRITDTLDGVLEKTLMGTAVARTDTTGGPAASPLRLEELALLRRHLGSVHLLWDFFRDKFAQRDTRLFTSHLAVADALAWELYRMFWERAVSVLEAEPGQGPVSPTKLKEPPLIFYHVERTFLAQPRVSSFSVPGLAAKDIRKFYYALRNLPVPIIGLPWYQAGRLPALVFVGHEVGHVVAEDLDLDEEFDGLVTGLGLDEAHSRVWRAWADELFADVFGTLALGAAYVEQLAVELADGFNAVVGEQVRTDEPGAYPTRALRIALCTEALRLVGAPLERPFFARDFPVAGDSDRYIEDVPGVVQAFVRGPYARLGGVGLDAVLGWNTEVEARVEDLAVRTLAEPERAMSASVRVFVAAAVRARLRDAASYARHEQVLADRFADMRAKDEAAGQGHALRRRLVQVGIDPNDFVMPPSLSSLDRANGARLALSLDF